MAHHMTWEPASGVRQVNIRYKTNNAATADIERLRELTPYKNLNKLMLEALLIGSKVLLKEFEGATGGVVNISSAGRPVALGGPSVNAIPAREKPESQGAYLEPLGLEGVRQLIAKQSSVNKEGHRVNPQEESQADLNPQVEAAASTPVVATQSDEAVLMVQPDAFKQDAGGLIPEAQDANPLSNTSSEVEQNLEQTPAPVATAVKFSATAKKHLNSW